MIKNGRGFTLTELLAVIVISAAGLLLLIPAYLKAGEGGERAVCMDNLRRLGQAAQKYSQDFGGWLPVGGSYRTGRPWPAQIIFAEWGYMRRMDTWVCPSIAPYRYDRKKPDLTYAVIRSNNCRQPPGEDCFCLPAYMREPVLHHSRDGEWTGQSYLELRKIDSPRDYVITGEQSNADRKVQGGNWTLASPVHNLHMRHGDVTGMLFSDGHVEAADIRRVRELKLLPVFSVDFDMIYGPAVDGSR